MLSVPAVEYDRMKADTMILATDIFQYLIKEVFGTYSFPETKWNCVWEIPDIGRTYFQDRKDKECPINRDGREKMKLLYESALSGKMKISDMTISSKLSSLFQNVFHLNYSFLVYYDDDTDDLRNAKRGSWLLLLDTVLSKLEDKTNIDLMDYIDIYNEYSSICQRIERVAVETYTEILLTEMQKPEREQKEKLARSVAREVFVTGEKSEEKQLDHYTKLFGEYYRPSKGMILFFLNSSIANVMEFAISFTKYSNLDIRRMWKYKCSVEGHELPKLDSICISYDEWNKKKNAGEILVIYENKFLCSGYDS